MHINKSEQKFFQRLADRARVNPSDKMSVEELRKGAS